LENLQCLFGVARLNHPITAVPQVIGDDHAHQNLILNDKNGLRDITGNWLGFWHFAHCEEKFAELMWAAAGAAQGAVADTK